MAAGGGAFPGFEFHHPTSVLQECTPALLATIVFGGIGIPAAQEFADFLFCGTQMVLGFTKTCCYKLCRFIRRI